MTIIKCAAVLFDLDGVLVDSSAVIKRHWYRWAERHGLDPEETYQAGLGKRTVEQVRMFAPHLDVEAEAHKIDSAEAVDAEGVKEIPGAAILLDRLPADRWGIVTSGTHDTATTRIAAVGLSRPQVFITAEDVVHGKPDPEAYLLGAEGLGASPEKCLVLEDSPSGVAAAKSAGMQVIAVASTHDTEDLRVADVVVRDLQGFEVRLQDTPGRDKGGRSGQDRIIEFRIDSEA
jgi:sugar-phosphatase